MNIMHYMLISRKKKQVLVTQQFDWTQRVNNYLRFESGENLTKVSRRNKKQNKQ